MIVCVSSELFRSDFVQILTLGQILDVRHRVKETPAVRNISVEDKEVP